jgi:hypothetical protein
MEELAKTTDFKRTIFRALTGTIYRDKRGKPNLDTQLTLYIKIFRETIKKEKKSTKELIFL